MLNLFNEKDLQEEIGQFLFGRGVDLFGFAPVSRWEDYEEVHPDFRPQELFPAKTVIVAGMGMPLPVVETTPSAIHMELYRTVNRELDSTGYYLAQLLNQKGIPSMSFPRDGYGSIQIIKEKPRAAFAHVNAAKYAGLGTIGVNNVLLTPSFGPRVRWVSVFTSMEFEGSPMQEKDLCIRCHACAACCPVEAIIPREDRFKPDFDSLACANRAEDLTKRRCYPCGICVKVCPVGEDRKLFASEKSMSLYLNEKGEGKDPMDVKSYKRWNHFRKWGSWTEEETKDGKK